MTRGKHLAFMRPNHAVNTDARRQGFARAAARRLPYSLGLGRSASCSS